jgi:DNA primase
MVELTTEKIKELLDKYEVPYIEKGKNIGTDFYGMNCPFCEDDSNHLGINRNKGYFTCWRCRASGSFFELLQQVAGVTWSEFQRDLKIGNITTESALARIHKTIHGEKEEEETEDIKKCVLPKFVYPIRKSTDLPLLDKFLNRRGYTIQDCIEHNCYYGRAGEMTHRLIIPVHFDGKLVSFTGADMTGTSRLKYKTSSTKINNYLYNFDTLAERGMTRMVITEGIFDVWRIGEEGVCTFGTHITKPQRDLILCLQLDELVIAWDEDAYWKAREEVKQFQPFISSIKIVKFPKNEDPDSYGKKYGTRGLRKLILETEPI